MEFFQWKLDLGTLLQIIVFMVGGVVVILTMRYDVRTLKERLTDVEKSLLEMTKTLTSVLITDARTDERIGDLEEKEAERRYRAPNGRGRKSKD